MHVALACGGTGGHIFPGLATADVLRSRGHNITLWLAGKDGEKEAVAGWISEAKGDIITVPAQGFYSFSPFRVLQTCMKLYGAYRRCHEQMRRHRPDVLLAMGSYASFGPVLAARRLRVPVVLHEANVIPGRAVRLLSRLATAVAATFEESRFYLRGRDLVITGMPVRRELMLPEPPGLLKDLEPGVFTLLVMGGSRGAKRLNELAVDALCRLHQAGRPLQVIHLAGRAMEEQVRGQYEQAGIRAKVMAFTPDMASVYASSSLAVSRSGASSCAELALFGVPSLLVPYPFAAGGHQSANAQAMVKAGAADMVEEKQLTQDWLLEYLVNSIDSPERLERMSQAARRLGDKDGAELLASVVEKAAGERGTPPPEA